MELIRISKNRGKLRGTDAPIYVTCAKKGSGTRGTRVNIHLAGEQMADAGLRCGDRVFILVSRDLSVMEIVRTTSHYGYTISSPGTKTDGEMRPNGCIAIQKVTGTPLAKLKLGDRIEYAHTAIAAGKVAARRNCPVAPLNRAIGD